MTPEFVRKHTIYKILRNPSRFGIQTTTGYVSYEELKRALEDEFYKHDGESLYSGLTKNSQRNIKRDINDIQLFFDVEIEIKRNHGYAIIDKADLTNEQQLIFDKMELFLAIDKEKKWQPFVTPEKSSIPDYIDIIEIFYAIKNKVWITFNYNAWYDDGKIKETKLTIQPLHLKQSNRGWYLYGYDTKNGVYPYCLDNRIGRIEISKKPIKAHYPFDKNVYFQNLFGVLDNCKPETITIQVVNHHFKYLESRPFPNQEIIHRPKKETTKDLNYLDPDIWGGISFFAQPNYELLMELFRYNIWVKVISPTWFAEKLASQYQFLLHQYYPQFIDDSRDYFIK